MSEDKFYISDTHFWHDNILTFDNRPYEDCMEMAVDMKRRWNEHVPTSAHVYILGDVTWKWGDYVKKYIQSLNGNKHLILGNHDKCNAADFKKLFVEIVPYKKMKDTLNGKPVQLILSHYYMPFYEGHYYNNIHLHGHSHATAESKAERKITEYLLERGYPEIIYNVGCMYPYMDYTPRTLEEITDRYSKWEKYGDSINESDD